MQGIFAGVTNVHLLAEHGFQHRVPHSHRPLVGRRSSSALFGGQSGGGGPWKSRLSSAKGDGSAGTPGGVWQTIRLTLDNSWRAVALQIMRVCIIWLMLMDICELHFVAGIDPNC